MAVRQNLRILGTGSYLPARQVTAEELDKRCGLATGWCRKHVGVLTRYECLAPETMITMAGKAIELAMADAQIDWPSIDAIVDCSTSQFRPIPCNAAHHQSLFPGAAGIPCFDVHSSCLGALVAINLVNGMFGAGAFRNVLVVASESGVGGVHYGQPESACLIGDGAAAMILTREETDSCLVFSHETYAEHIELCRVEGGGHKLPVFNYSVERDADYRFSMDGPGVFRVALKRLKPMVRKALADFTAANRDFDSQSLHFIPHQASPRALQAVRSMLRVSPERFHSVVGEVGNLVAASIPFMLDSVRKRKLVARGDKLILLGTSAGYSQAALLMEL